MTSNEDEIQCETMWRLSEEKKYDEIVDHLLTSCLKCITNPKKRFNGREMLFPDAPPPWIKIPENEKTNPLAWKKYEKKKVNVQMTPEEFEQFLIDSDLGDERMTHEIAKFFRIERLGAWAKLREIRSKQRENRQKSEKEAKIMQKKELEAKKEAEKLKKADEKRKSTEAKKQKEDEKNEYLEKIDEEKRMLEAILDEGDERRSGAEEESFQDQEAESSKHKKEFNLRNQMPWCPNPFDILCSDQRSAVDQAEQKRVIAMCQNLMYYGTFQHASNKRELKDVRKASEPEYDALVAAALEHASKETCHPVDYITGKITHHTLSSFERRAPPVGNFQFKSPIFTLEARSADGLEGIRSEKQAQMPILERILKTSAGNDILTVPDITKKCQVIKDKRQKGRKVSVKKDEVVRRLLNSTSSVSVAMDVTTACHLLAPNWESREYEFAIPIRVEQKIVGGTVKKHVILSKPYPCNMITKTTVQRKSLKTMLKNQFVENFHIEPPKPKEKPPQARELSPEKEKVSAAPSTSSTNNFLDDLLAEMDKTVGKSEKNQEKSIENEKIEAETGYQYSIFACGHSKMLIRSKPPYKVIEASDKKHTILEHKKVSFEPRIEYLPNGGAMDLSAAEWVWNYSKRLLKQSEAHILYRTSYKLDNILQIDALTMQMDVCEPPPDALALLSTRSMMLEELIGRLEMLEVGEYLAYQESNKPLVVVAKCDPNMGVSTAALKITENDIRGQADDVGNDYFHGFAPDVAFQWQIVQGRAPRMLIAKDSPIVDRLPSRSNRNKMHQKKHNLKRQFGKREGEMSQKKQQKLDLDDPNLYADFTNPSVLKGSRQGGNWKRGGGGGKRGRGRGGQGRQRNADGQWI